MSVSEFRDGRWRPAIPLPLFLPLHVRCRCGRRFWGLRTVTGSAASDRYERHYRLAHTPGKPA